MGDANRNFEIISGRAHPELAHEISEYLDMPLIEMDLGDFPARETFLRIKESVRGKHVFALQSHGGRLDPDKAIMEQVFMARTAFASDAAKITGVMPYQGYMRSDKNDRGRVVPAARIVVDMLTKVGLMDSLIAMELHAGQLQHFTELPYAHINSNQYLIRYILETFSDEIARDKFVLAAPDAGRLAYVRKIQEAIKIPFNRVAVVNKDRSDNSSNGSDEITNDTSFGGIIGNVKGMTVLQVDDMIDTGGTQEGSANTLMDEGEAAEVHAYATHPVLSTKEGVKAVDRIGKSVLKSMAVTNTLPMLDEDNYGKFKVIKVGELIGKAIRNKATNRSISALF